MAVTQSSPSGTLTSCCDEVIHQSVAGALQSCRALVDWLRHPILWTYRCTCR